VSREAVAVAIRGATRITIICHENPDADTLGSALALQMAAERLGKQVEVVAADPVPPALAALPRIREVRATPSLEPDLALVTDGPPSRTGAIARDCAEWLARTTIVNVDHHVSNDGSEAAIAWVDAEAAATCEMVALLVPTHTFAHPNATPRTLRVAASLVEAGAPLSSIHRSIYADKPFSTLALWGRILAGATERHDGRIVSATMTAEMLRETGTEPVASEGFIDLLASTRAADVTIVFKEADPAETRVSVRTSSRADAVAITSAFGGGGHARAAGATVQAPLEEAVRLVLEESERELDRADARGR
jgi:phosphoesterase RecJ-like protein